MNDEIEIEAIEAYIRQRDDAMEDIAIYEAKIDSLEKAVSEAIAALRFEDARAVFKSGVSVEGLRNTLSKANPLIP